MLNDDLNVFEIYLDQRLTDAYMYMKLYQFQLKISGLETCIDIIFYYKFLCKAQVKIIHNLTEFCKKFSLNN